MKRIILTLVIILAITGLVYFAGCSDDDETSTGTTTKPAGDTLDYTYIGAEQALSDAMNNVPLELNAMINGLWGVLDSMASLPSAKPLSVLQPDTVWYNADNSYWYAIEETTGLSNSYQIDSLQFMHGNTAVQWPDTAQLTRINGGMYAVVTNGVVSKAVAADTLFKYTFQGSVFGEAGNIAAYSDVTVVGAGSVYLQNMPVKDASVLYCQYAISDNFVIGNVQLNLYLVFDQGSCPESGTITHNAALTLSCSGDSTFTNTDNWYAQESFVNDSSHFVVENSKYRWEKTEDCGGGGN